jgi:hypothetical protein
MISLRAVTFARLVRYTFMGTDSGARRMENG